MHVRSVLVSFAYLFLAFLLTACEIDLNGQAPAPERIEAPAEDADLMQFELAGRGDAALIVPAFVNGQGPHQFVLDTGATLTCLSSRLVQELDLPEQEGEFGIGATVEGAGPMRIVQVDSLRLGETMAYNMDACELDLAHMEQLGIQVDGLIGLNFLRSFRMTLDFGDNTLLLEEL